MKKPHIILHMVTTLNGRISTDNWKNTETWKELEPQFQPVYDSFLVDGWICGRVTLENEFSDEIPQLKPVQGDVERNWYMGNPYAKTYAIAVDTKGTLGWSKNEIDGDHIVVLVSEKASNEYLFYLQNKQISYIVAGENDINFVKALDCLVEKFKIKRLLLQGGGHLNGGLIHQGLVDEYSIILAPIVDLKEGPTTFDYTSKDIIPASDLKLDHQFMLSDNLLWLRYSKR